MAAGDRIFMAKESTSQEILSNTKKIIEDAKAKPKRFLSVEGGAMALIKSVKTVTKKDTGKQHENEPDDINADNNEEVQG